MGTLFELTKNVSDDEECDRIMLDGIGPEDAEEQDREEDGDDLGDVRRAGIVEV